MECSGSMLSVLAFVHVHSRAYLLDDSHEPVRVLFSERQADNQRPAARPGLHNFSWAESPTEHTKEQHVSAALP